MIFFKDRFYNIGMKLQKYLDKNHETQTEFAKRIGSKQSDVSTWCLEKVECPIKRCLVIEKVTEGAVTRKDLRKDWREIWPELINKKG